MSFQVQIVEQAEEDLWDIYQYVLAQDGEPRAEHVLERIEEACKKLATHPRIGHIPPELDRIGILDYLEIHFKPYRILYQIEGKKVFVHGILDGRRDMQDLLERRMIR